MRITVPPSPHRVHIVVHADHIETIILDIPDTDPCPPTIPHILIEHEHTDA